MRKKWRSKTGDRQAQRIALKVERALKGKLPSGVHSLMFETGDDWAGDPGVWVWVELEDDAAREEVFSSNVRRIRENLDRAVRKADSSHLPYIRFRTVSEMTDLGRHGRA